MKKSLFLLLLLMLASCSKEPSQTPLEAPSEPSIDTQASSQAQAPWLENIHYIVLDQPASETPQVQEFFSFWCPHCHNFEPIVALIKDQLDAGTAFKKVHVDFMGFTSKEIQQSASQAMLIADYMGKEDVINSAIFDHIHVEKKEITGLADIEPLFLANQVSAQDFATVQASPELAALVQAHSDTFTQYRSNIQSVPTFIVNGKYQVKFTQEMDINDMVNLIAWLTTQ
jgi:thiol:disulfide interchange protein DsbA